MSQKEMTAPTPVVDQGASEVALPAPDLSVLTDQPAAEPVKDEKTKQDKQELTETTPASVGLVVALVVVSIVVAVVVAMWMVSPLMALLLGAGLIVVAVLAGAGWLAWRKATLRKRGGRDGAGRAGDTGTSPRGGSKPNGGKSGLWPFSRNTNGGKAPAGSKPNGGGKAPAGSKPNGNGKPAGGGLWPFSRNTNGGGKAPAGSKPNGGGKAPAGGKPTGNGKAPSGGKPNGNGKPTGGKSGLWPFSRNTNGGGKAPAGSKPNGGGKAPAGGKPTGGGNSNSNGGGKPAGKSKPGGGSVLLGLLARAVKDKSKDKTKSGEQAGDKQQGGKDDSAGKGRTRQAPGGHRPETVIDVDLDDISAPGVWPGPSASGPTAPRTAPRTATPPFDPGPTTDRSGWFDRAVPTSLRTAPHQTPVSHPYGGPEMSSTTTTTGGDIDQDAMRVANRYAGLIAKQETLMGRASACRDAADQYRRDARANQESAENHKQAARTIRDRDVAADHGRQAREAEAEAAREILAARYYEEQAEAYEAQARAIGF